MKPKNYEPSDFSTKHGYRKLAKAIEAGRGLEGLVEFFTTHGNEVKNYKVYVPSPHVVDRRAKRRIAQSQK